MVDSTYSYDGTSTSVGSVPTSPGFVLSKTSTGGSMLRSGQAQRSTSMEWGNASSQGGNNRLLGTGGWLSGAHFRESSLGLNLHGVSGGAGTLRGSTLSLAVGTPSHYSLLQTNSRCGRSVSPEVSIKKISNYPDPTPGFMIRPSSRQGSQDSLCSLGDYTQRSFTLPGKPPIRSAISPARRKFFEDPPVGTTVKATTLSVPETLPPPAPEPPKDKTKNLSTPSTREELLTKQSVAPDTSSASSETSKSEKKRKSSKTKEKEPKSSTTEPTETSSKSESIVDRLKSFGRNKSPRSGSTEPSSTPKPSQSETKPVKTDSATASKLGDTGKPSVKPTPSSFSVTSTGKTVTTTRSVSQPAPLKTTKASVTVSNISPSIMALRQKFSGGASKG